MDGLRQSEIVTGTTTTLTDLMESVQYTVKVYALNYMGESMASNEVSYVTGVTVSGKLSFTGKVGGLEATVALLQGGQEKYSTKVAYGEAGTVYTLKNVAAGTYTLQITKLGHLTYTDPAFVVGDRPIELNDFKLFAGKVTDTGETIEQQDVDAIIAKMYTLDPLCDLNENGKVTFDDLVILIGGRGQKYETLTAKQ